MLDHIITSKTRKKIIDYFFNDVGQWVHMRKVAREVSEEINAVKRELDILEKAGLLQRERRLNKVLFAINDKYVFFHELLAIYTKSTPFAKSFIKNLSRLGSVKNIVFSEKLALKKEILESEVYILIIGTVVIDEVVKIVGGFQSMFPFEINYTIMTKDEFVFRKKNKDPFIWNFLHQPKIMVVGTEEELLS